VLHCKAFVKHAHQVVHNQYRECQHVLHATSAPRPSRLPTANARCVRLDGLPTQPDYHNVCLAKKDSFQCQCSVRDHRNALHARLVHLRVNKL
jgi:hypothetical protein